MIQISRAALQEIKRLQRRHRHEEATLRLEVVPGGCMDMHYLLSFTTSTDTSDYSLSHEGLDIAIPSSCVSFVEGLSIDYSEDLMGGGFRFQNPNASQTCGCSHSFMLDSPES